MNEAPEKTFSESAPASGAEWTRRSFLKIMGLGALGTAFSLPSCRSAGQYIVPYKNTPEWSLPGKPSLYATTCPAPWGGIPLIATSHEGRPTMLETSREHPGSCGCPTYATASLWDLYSPDRSRHLLFHGKKVAEGEVMGPAEFAGAFRAWTQRLRNKESCALVLENQDSPTLRSLLRRLQAQNPNLKLYQDDTFTGLRSRTALNRFYQRPVRELIHFSRAERILSLDCDFLGLDVRGNTTGFFEKRIPDGKLPQNRLYSLESGFTLTGGMADHRLPVLPGKIPSFLRELTLLLSKEKTEFAAPLANLMNKWPDGTKAEELAKEEKHFLSACVRDLARHAGKSLILAGDSLPEEYHEIVHLCNLALQANAADGTLTLLPDEEYLPFSSLGELKKDLEDSKISLLFWLSPGDPVYARPAGAKESSWIQLLSTPGLDTVHWGLYANATAHACTWHIPAAHFLESWEDSQSPDNVLSLTQPLILPLFGGTGRLELLMGLMGKKGILTTADTARGNLSPAYSAVKTTFTRRLSAGDRDHLWQKALKNGFSVFPASAPLALSSAEFSRLTAALEERLHRLPRLTPSKESTNPEYRLKPEPISTLLFCNSYSTWDGRYLNNAWMQECPDPLTKLTWGNSALVSPATGKKLSPVTEKKGIRLTPKEKDQSGSALELPLHILPGLPDGLIVLPVGYGQKHCGLIGENNGVDVNGLRHGDRTWVSSQVPANSPHFLDFTCEVIDWNKETPSLTQQESTTQGLPLVRKTLTGHPLPPITGEDPLHQWGMCIDLSKCTGCNACVLACQAENNIPLVGRDQAAQSRIMHWLRVDRYFEEKSGLYDSLMQPVACQQCENAPCESVCPLSATAHTEDGLNAMAYSRCAGTRYCANNCPYKVRRFNYFDFNKYNPFLKNNLAKGPWGTTQTGEGPHLQRNPNVTVRMRGIMEKCTYCVQRIEAAKIRQKRAVPALSEQKNIPSSEIKLKPEDLRIPADSFTCACQAACPAGAITFGNLLDGEKAAVYRARTSPRAYTLLDHLGVHPRTAYLTRQRNPNPGLGTQD